jgi:ACR3 family arsenite transporter
MTMSRTTTQAPAAPEHDVLHRLSVLNRFLPAWIGAAMVLGVVLGRLIPSLDDWLDTVKVGTVSLPIAIGLLVMMYPVLAKVKYSRIREALSDRRAMGLAMLFNWVVGPIVMFALAWLMLPDLPAYRTGLIIVGLAPCIAMVLIWNDLAGGDRELAAVLVPLAAGFLTRHFGERAKGTEWYEDTFLPRIGPTALYGLLFTVVVLFALQGHTISERPWDVARIALPLLAFFAIMWSSAFFLARSMGLSYARTTTVAFTAASNNFELAIAVAIGVFGVTSGEALAGVVGPLIEVPVLVGLVYVALWARRRFYPRATN